MSSYVYVLQSLKDKKLYIGITNNLLKRLNQHNQGENPSTKCRAPFKLIYSEKYTNYKKARIRENFLKSGQGRKWMKNNILL